MSTHSHGVVGSEASVLGDIRSAIVLAIPDALVEVSGGGGHFTIDVVSVAFEGKNTLARHRLVLGAIAPLMSGGDAARVHAVDTLNARTPSGA
ncbi:MAG: hypothetical protein NVSMB1_26310 [Polyangiales bacterium]